MKTNPFLFALALTAMPLAAQEVKLVRYPHYHQGRVAFSHLGDIWTAAETGRDVRRLTAHSALDTYPRFSPDGQWIAFSSDRNGNLDVFLLPAAGGTAKQLTFHSAADSVLGWTPDSRSVLFASQRSEDFMGRLYTVSVDGGLPKNAGPDMGIQASYSPDGARLALNRKGQSYWRKFYRGSMNTDVTVMDLAAKKFTDLTDFDGIDSWPMWARDGFIYFVSDRDGGGVTNIWRISEKAASAKVKPEKVTAFKDGDVRWPSMSTDGKVIVFERDHGISKLDLATRKVTPVSLSIAAETQESLAEVRTQTSTADAYDLSPDGRRVALSAYGELFTAPTSGEGDLRQITDGPSRDRAPRYSPDGKHLAFVSDKSGREEIYVTAADGSGEPQKITDLDALKYEAAWSPDSKHIAFGTSDYKLRKYTLESKQTIELASSKFGPISDLAWSPDGQWIACAKMEHTRGPEVYLVSAAGGEEHKVTFDTFGEFYNPQFSSDGKKLFYIRGEHPMFGEDSDQIYSVALERQERDPDDPELRAERENQTPEAKSEGASRRPAAANAPPPKPVAIDWAGLKRRTRPVTRLPHPVNRFAVAPDGRTLVFVVNEPAGTRSAPVLYSIQEDGRRLTRITSSAPPDEEGGGGPRGFGNFGFGGMSSFRFSRDGRTLYFLEGRGIHSVSMPAAPPPGAGRDSAPPRGGPESPRRRVSFTAKVRIDRPAEWAQMFDDAWRTMKYRFYDPKMHGHDWDAARAKYQPLVQFVGERQELLNIINEMIGELNASHTGAAPPPSGARPGAVSSSHLGIELAADQAAGLYKVAHVYEGGPADKDWVKVGAGDFLISIDGKPVKAGDNFWKLLNNQRLNRKCEVVFNNKPGSEGAWTTKIEPVPIAAYSQLRYDRWVKERRETADKLSGGRVGYLHIQAMNPASLRKFERELLEFRAKEALIIDERWNGGGNIEQQLLAILGQKQYQVWQPRGTEQTSRPLQGYFGPKVVLQNWRSGSNAEMFPAGFRALGLGKVIGTPTVGAVIGTGSYSLIDGSTVRTPAVGVFLADSKKTNMENYGVPPDILVENTPEDNLAGRDRQLEVAVQELLKELATNGKTRISQR
ncbi:MAG: S41 family peptidase [Bryobacteraceae bacterium]